MTVGVVAAVIGVAGAITAALISAGGGGGMRSKWDTDVHNALPPWVELGAALAVRLTPSSLPPRMRRPRTGAGRAHCRLRVNRAVPVGRPFGSSLSSNRNSRRTP